MPQCCLCTPRFTLSTFGLGSQGLDHEDGVTVPGPEKKKLTFPEFGELLKFGCVYFFLALIELAAKLTVTRAWFDGTLIENHKLLLAFQYTNNEQSRLLQFFIPEAFVHLLGVSVIHAYIIQRWLFVFVALVCFHAYLRRWFDVRLAFAGVMTLAAIMPLSFFNDLQESSPLLLVTFLLGLWVIREHRPGWYVLILIIGSINNETMLFLPLVFLLYNYTGVELRRLGRLILVTLGTSLPAFLIVATIRYVNRDRPHLGGAWHLPDNVAGVLGGLKSLPLDYWQASYLYLFFIFGALWVFAILSYSRKPLFLRRAVLMLPAFMIGHFLTGRINEVRQMLPLSFVIIPMAFFYLFPAMETDKTIPQLSDRNITKTSAPTE